MVVTSTAPVTAGDLPLPLVSRGAAVLGEIVLWGKKQTCVAGSPLACRPYEHRECVHCLLLLYMVLNVQMALNAYCKVPMSK